MRDHTVVHGKKAKEHEQRPLWEECLLQSYFATRSRVDYFVVIEEGTEGAIAGLTIDPVLSQLETDLFAKLEKDYQDVKGDVEEQASIVHDFGDSKSERMPWLETTRFPSHMAKLRDEEIRDSAIRAGTRGVQKIRGLGVHVHEVVAGIRRSQTWDLSLHLDLDVVVPMMPNSEEVQRIWTDDIVLPSVYRHVGSSTQQHLPTSYRLLRLNSGVNKVELGLKIGDTPLCVSFRSDSLEGVWADIVRKTKENGFEEFSDTFLVALGQ